MWVLGWGLGRDSSSCLHLDGPAKTKFSGEILGDPEEYLNISYAQVLLATSFFMGSHEKTLLLNCTWMGVLGP